MLGSVRALFSRHKVATRVKKVLTTYQVLLDDCVIIADSTAAAFTITMPDPGEAAGLAFTIIAPEGATQDTVTVSFKGPTGAAVTLALDADDDAAYLFSDGVMFWCFHYETVVA